MKTKHYPMIWAIRISIIATIVYLCTNQSVTTMSIDINFFSSKLHFVLPSYNLPSWASIPLSGLLFGGLVFAFRIIWMSILNILESRGYIKTEPKSDMWNSIFRTMPDGKNHVDDIPGFIKLILIVTIILYGVLLIETFVRIFVNFIAAIELLLFAIVVIPIIVIWVASIVLILWEILATIYTKGINDLILDVFWLSNKHGKREENIPTTA